MPLTEARSKRIRKGKERATSGIEGDVFGDHSGDDAQGENSMTPAAVSSLSIRREGEKGQGCAGKAHGFRFYEP